MQRYFEKDIFNEINKEIIIRHFQSMNSCKEQLSKKYYVLNLIVVL